MSDPSEQSAPSSGKPGSPSPRSFQAPTGTRDFYPADLNKLRFIQDAWRRTSINHGFDEIDGPTFEHLDLYTVKSGEGIVSELFSFERFGGEKKFALRPEFTPTLARLYASKANALPKPTKWFWLQNCFRAERPQRGRLREFYQWNCDIIGDGSPAADAEIIACCIGLLESVGLTPDHVRVKISSRQFIQDALNQAAKGNVGTIDLDAALRVLDARSKMSTNEFSAALLATGVRVEAFDSTVTKIEELLQSASDESGTPDAQAPALPPAMPFLALCWHLGQARLLEWCDVDFSITRGLAYYTGMVFEVHEASGAERAIAGGGRYDGLIELFGGPPTPAVGFGMGDVVLSLVLQDRGKFPKDEELLDRLGLRPDAFVISNGSPEADAALAPTVAALRRAGLHARRSYKASKNVGKLLQDGVKARARFAVIIEDGAHATVKNLDTQQQDAEKTPLARLAERVGRR